LFSRGAIRKIAQVDPIACGVARYVGEIELTGPVITHGATSRQVPFEGMDPIMGNGACM